MGSHRIDLMRYLIGSDVKRVFAYLTKLNPNIRASGDDNAMTILEYQNGVRGVLISSRTSYNGNDRMTQLFGTEGAITLYGETHSVIVEKKIEKKVYILLRMDCHNPSWNQPALSENL
ncbi:Gfo/Idh/MocA family oxidoreductase [Neobacillus cucumis]|uniref:Gfo/Idh/MocA family protein n=1 Tax=Neobacillus cucumis TaxID=1740721 RepID=UPI002E1ACD14|nr:Gfo/Idh/MocA family oxidoreductase [Neobacillus cucumis]